MLGGHRLDGHQRAKRHRLATALVWLAAAVLLWLAAAAPARAIDLAPLWDFGNPELSEQRFRSALSTATGDDALILQTQIARTYGLRKQFHKAQELLHATEPQFAGAGFEARARFALELGRTYASGTHPPQSQTNESKERARVAYSSAIEIAKAGQLDGLTIDALHMLAFVDTAPADQLRWGQAALAVIDASSQPAAKRWEASIRNNIGIALHELGQYEPALAQFRQALAIRERGSNAQSVRTAHWMVAWTLRALNRPGEALEVQLRLERESEVAGKPDPYVFEELEILYQLIGNEARAAHYASLRKAGTTSR